MENTTVIIPKNRSPSENKNSRKAGIFPGFFHVREINAPVSRLVGQNRLPVQKSNSFRQMGKFVTRPRFVQ
ncbi:MAG TPA: hypothetical protein IAC82_00700 [Candidatus Merdivicinus intestinigallinarum]|nr:hypothetical protein [Candidatus Merdivicinus intestinigallinarum]